MPLPVTEVERELRHTRRVRYEGYKRADGPVGHRGAPHRRQEPRLPDEDRRAPRRAADPRDVAAPHHRPPLQRARRRGDLRRGALSRRLRDHRAGLQAADRPESDPRISGKSVKQLFGGVKAARTSPRCSPACPPPRSRPSPARCRKSASDGRKPFQLDQCHALDTTSETVRKWYPKWYRKTRRPAALDRRQCRRAASRRR